MKIILLLLAILGMTAIHQPAGASGLDLGKALTIGSGAKSVIEFTDPDCPYCRKAAKYFEGRSDVTQHIFFLPLPRHPQAREKVRYILSQTDRAGAYHAVMSGRLDNLQKFDGINQTGIKLQEEQLEIVKKQKIESTPTFIINGRIIIGFDLKKIEEALGSR